MKQKLLAVALVSALPLFAHAQSSVTVYGTLDASIGVENNDAPGTESRTVVQSGTQSASRIGFRGTEDLGNGLKALFNIEASIAADTGGTDSNLWQRRAVVGLQGDFGTLTVGREYSPIAAVAAASDILGHGFYGSSLVVFNTPTGAQPRLTRRLSNSVNYKSNAVSGFTVGAAYSTGESNIQDGPTGDLAGVSVEYANAGFYLGAGYHQIERLASGDDKEYGVGAGYKFGPFEVRAGYLAANPEGGNNKYEQANAGVSYEVGVNKFFLNYNQQELETGAKGRGVTLAYSYTLSKRTNIYASYAKLRNNDLGTFSLTSPANTIALPATAFGADPQVYNLGIRHSF